jgi:hypothetical protein
MKREKICSEVIMIAGKNYICKVINDSGKDCNKIVMKGVNLVKKTLDPVIATKLKNEALEFIFKEDFNGLNQWLREYRKEFGKLPLNILGSSTGISVPLEKYINNKGEPIKGTPRHIKGCIAYNNLIEKYNITQLPKIKEGNKVNVIYMKPEFGSNVFCFIEDFPDYIDEFKELKKYVDYDMMWEKLILMNLNQILSVMGRTLIESEINSFSLF